jgi:hypothetical protein
MKNLGIRDKTSRIRNTASQQQQNLYSPALGFQLNPFNMNKIRQHCREAVVSATVQYQHRYAIQTKNTYRYMH